MLTCYIQGGLGNQLFQIFTTINYALKYKKVFAFTNQTQLDRQRSTYWQTLLEPLAKFTKEINYNELNKDKCNIFIHKQSITNKFSFYKEKDFTYTELPNINNDNILLIGYFQSHKYFAEYSKSIIKLIKLEEQRVKTQLTFKKYSLNNTVSIHFRRGDYKSLQDHFILLDYNYYHNSLKYILEQEPTTVSNAIVFCEKNDLLEILSIIDKLKQNYPTLIFEIIDFSITDWQQLLLMSVCKHNIIANSTFSWWGAYFNTNPNKIVCYPDRWFGIKHSQHNVKDLFPIEWTKVNSTIYEKHSL
jgi:hypothetical protein